MSDIARKPAAIRFGAVLALACATRFMALADVPPALIPDEASNAYDAYCLLETGEDRWGVTAPVLLEAFGKGDHRPALYAYLTVPFVALLGPEHLDEAARLPAACCGVLTIACFYLLVGRVCDRRTALWAALLLALSPWHVRMSRFGHESSLTPVFLVVALLVLTKAGWPLREPINASASRARLRGWWMAACGTLVGLSLCSYASMKLFAPAMVLAGTFIYRDVWVPMLKRPESRRALLAGLGAGAVVSAPIGWLTITRWSEVNARSEYVSLFHQGLSLPDALKQAGGQYLAHFGPTWLFTAGDASPLSSSPNVGQLNWYMLPMLAIGLMIMWGRRRENRIYALLFAWLLFHPLASALCTDGPHTARAACGIGAFQWVAAIGISGLTELRRFRVVWGKLFGGVLLVVVVLADGAWAFSQYVSFARSPAMTPLYQTDLRDAVLFLRGRRTDYDRVFISDRTSNERRWGNEHPYIYVLTYLPVEPSRFHAWEKVVGYRRPETGFHYLESAGPFTFSTGRDVLDAHFRTHPRQRVLIVGRPGDVGGGRLLHRIRDGQGRPRFEIIEVAPR